MIHRNASGRVDLADPIAAELLDRLDASPALAPEIARAAVELGWWELALSLLAPDWVEHGYASWHRQLVAWAMSLEPGAKPRPLVVCAPRGAGKSSILSLALLLILCRQSRRYGLYVSNTARQTEDAIAGMGELLGSRMLADAFPAVAEQYRTERGKARDWTKNRIRTASGFTLDGIGLDQAIRGARIGAARPDLIIFDDVEDAEDSPVTTAKKRRQMTDALIPAGSSDAAVVFVQNLIHPPGSDGIMAEIAEGRADMLTNAIVLGPVPMVENLELTEQTPTAEDDRRYLVTGGRPTWEGQSIELAEALINESGLNSFLRERQHEDVPADGGMFDERHWAKAQLADVDAQTIVRLCRSWDVAFTADGGDWTVGALIGLDKENRPYVLHVERHRLDAAAVLDLMEKIADLDDQSLRRKVPIVIEEMPAAGKAFRQQIERRLIGRQLHFVRPTASKDERALAWATEVQRGRATICLDRRDPRHDEAVSALIREHAAFPRGRHDDTVDASSQGFNCSPRLASSGVGYVLALPAYRSPTDSSIKPNPARTHCLHQLLKLRSHIAQFCK